VPTLPPAATPSGYITYHALAYADNPQQPVAVGPQTPLPAALATMPAKSVAIAGTTSASGLFGPFTPELGRPIWATLSGAWTGSVQLLRSSDGGATRYPLTIGGEAWAGFTGNACEQVAEETEHGATHYLDVALGTGTLTYRVAQ